MQILNIISVQNAMMLWAFSSLLLLLIIYLVRPRPKVQIVPSLMFFFKDNKTKQKSAFMQKVLRNILFMIQLAALAFLSLAATGPYFEMHANASNTHTVLIIDASASTQAGAGQTRFDQIKKIAKDNLGQRNSIILAQNYPVELSAAADKASSLQLIDKLKPKETQTNLGDAIQSAKELLEGQFGRVVVVSDFLYNTGSDVMVAKKAVENAGIPVLFKAVEGGSDNIGIVNAKIEKDITQVFIKNYQSTASTVRVSHLAGGATINGSTIELGPLVTDSVEFSTVPGESKVIIDVDDDFEVDNTACIFSPLKPRLSALIITNNEDRNLLLALSIMEDVDYEIAEPPIVPPVEDYDIIILSKVNRNLILPGTFEDIKKHVSEGAGAIIMVQEDTNQFDFAGLQPVTLRKLFKDTSVTLTLENELTKDVAFSPINKHFSGSVDEGSVVLAESDEGHPLIAYKHVGRGISFYYGLFDDESDFKLSTSYPIFFSRLIHTLAQRESAEDFNVKTGRVMEVPQTSIKTPTQSYSGSRVYFDEAGFYQVGEETICANLFDAKEGDIKISMTESISSELSKKETDQSTTKKFPLEMIAIGIALMILAAELLFIRYRGDI